MGQRYGLDDLAQRYLKVKLDGKDFGQNAQYEVDDLPARLIEYAAKDAYASRLIAQILFQILDESDANNTLLIDPPNDAVIGVGSAVELKSYGKVVARGCVGFVGNGGGRGEQRKWGDETIGAGKAMIQVDEVLAPGRKPATRHRNKLNPEKDWPKDAALGTLFKADPGLILGVRLRCLQVVISEEEGQTGSGGAAKARASSSFNLALADEIEKASSGNKLEVDNGAEDKDPPRSRGKSDLFHQCHALPLPQDCPAKPIACQIIIGAAWIKNREEDDNVREVLAKKGVAGLALREALNKPCWQSHARSKRAPAQVVASNLRRAQEVLKDDSACKERWSENVGACFRKLVEKAEKGWREDLDDYSLCQLQGCDSDGLPACNKDGGTSRNECYHQKLGACAPPWGLGARAARCLLLPRSFRLNVNAGITRHGEPSFGHPRLYFADRLQQRVSQTREVGVLPKRANGLEFQGADLISVGIGPLFLDPLCVKQGAPLPGMSPDANFMAKCMGVTCAPLPFSLPDEYKKFNQQTREDPNVNMKWCEVKAREHLLIADGKTVFPKAASMLWSHCQNSWKANQLIKQAQVAMGGSLKILSRELSGVRTEDPPDTFNHGSKRGIALKEESVLSSLVPPIVAPFQTKEIKTRPQLERLCAWSPLCECRAEECGGWTRSGCRTFSAGVGAKAPPTLEDLNIARKKDMFKPTTAKRKRGSSSENEKAKSDDSRDCAWCPRCALPVAVCGGYKCDSCCVYGGSNPIFSPPDMTSKFATEARKFKRTAQKALCREKRKAAKALARGEELPCLLDPVTIFGPMSTDRGTVVLSFRDTQNTLTSGSMLSDNVAQGCCNLTAQQLAMLGLSARIVSPQFYPTFCQHGWERVQRWVRATEVMESDWTSAPLTLIPIFTGPRNAGHWSGTIMDRTRGERGSGIRVHQDSLTPSAALSMSNMLKSQFAGAPILQNEKVAWVTAGAPVQARLSNDCAVHMCINFASYLKAVLDGCIMSGSGATSITGSGATSITAMSRLNQISPLEWGQQGRRHMLESFRAGRVDLNHPVITSLNVTLHYA